MNPEAPGQSHRPEALTEGHGTGSSQGRGLQLPVLAESHALGFCGCSTNDHTQRLKSDKFSYSSEARGRAAFLLGALRENCLLLPFPVS